MGTTINESDIMEYLQKVWDAYCRAEKRGVSCDMLKRRVNVFYACCAMAHALTGNEYDVADDKVYVVEEEV